MACSTVILYSQTFYQLLNVHRIVRYVTYIIFRLFCLVVNRKLLTVVIERVHVLTVQMQKRLNAKIYLWSRNNPEHALHLRGN